MRFSTGFFRQVFALLVVQLWACGQLLHAQPAGVPVTVVLVDGTPDAATEQLLKTAVSKWILAMNAFSLEKKDAFPAEPGGNAFRNLAIKHGLTAPYDTIRTIAVANGQTWDVHRVYVNASQGDYPGWQELNLKFSKTGALQSAFLADETQTPDKYLAFDAFLADEDKKMATDAMTQFATVFMSKNAVRLTGVIDPNASILSSQIPRNASRRVFTAFTAASFIKRTKERTFNTRDDIELRFENMEVFAHGDLSGLAAVTAKQILTTSRFVDEGYVFFAFDIAADPPVVLTRHWQDTPFEPTRPPVIAKPPKSKFYLYPVDLAGDSTLLNKVWSEGVMEFRTTGIRDSEQWSAAKLASWLKIGQLKLNNISIFADEVAAVNDSTVLVPYEVNVTDPVQEASVIANFPETPGFGAVEQAFLVYPGKRTIISARAQPEAQTPPARPAFNPYGTLFVVTSVREAVVNISLKSGILIKSLTGDQTNTLTIPLVEGGYSVEISKGDMHDPVSSEIFVNREAIARLEIILPRRATPLPSKVKKEKPKKGLTADKRKKGPQESPTPIDSTNAPPLAAESGNRKTSSRESSEEQDEESPRPVQINKTRLYIVGGAIVVIGTGVALAGRSGGTSSGIPTPPSRPSN